MFVLPRVTVYCTFDRQDIGLRDSSLEIVFCTSQYLKYTHSVTGDRIDATAICPPPPHSRQDRLSNSSKFKEKTLRRGEVGDF